MKFLKRVGRLYYYQDDNGGYVKRLDFNGRNVVVSEAELVKAGVLVVSEVKKETPKPVLEESGSSAVVSVEDKIKKKRGRPRKPDSEVSVRAMQKRRKYDGLSRPVGRPFVSPD